MLPLKVGLMVEELLNWGVKFMFNQIVKRHRPVAFQKKTELGSGYAHHLPAAHAAPEWRLATIEPCRRERQTQQESSVTSSQVTTSHDIPTNNNNITDATIDHR